jgi:hypothetical protein
MVSLIGYHPVQYKDKFTAFVPTTNTILFTIGLFYERPVGAKKTHTGIFIDMGIIRDYVEDNSTPFHKPKVPERKKVTELQAPKKNTVTMYNQIEMKYYILEEGYVNESNISVMLFTNGSVKITGIKYPMTIFKLAIEVLDLCIRSGSIKKNPGTENLPVKIWNPKPVMMNTKFRIINSSKPGLRFSELARILKEERDKDPVESESGLYRPILSVSTDKPSLINIKFLGDTEIVDEYIAGETRKEARKRKDNGSSYSTRKGHVRYKSEVSIRVYSTGTINIVGTDNPRYMKKAYDYICGVIQSSPSIFSSPKIRSL